MHEVDPLQIDQQVAHDGGCLLPGILGNSGGITRDIVRRRSRRRVKVGEGVCLLVAAADVVIALRIGSGGTVRRISIAASAADGVVDEFVNSLYPTATRRNKTRNTKRGHLKTMFALQQRIWYLKNFHKICAGGHKAGKWHILK